MEEPTFLSKKNAHQRDAHISFDEGPHIYTIDGDSDYMSVTSWNSTQRKAVGFTAKIFAVYLPTLLHLFLNV